MVSDRLCSNPASTTDRIKLLYLEGIDVRSSKPLRELKFLLISKIDSVTQNNVVTVDNRKFAKGLQNSIKDQFSSLQASNRAQIFKKENYIKFKEDSFKNFITDVKVSIKKLVEVEVGVDEEGL
ncbi:hypothetical protein VP01_4508g3 [Puccinia sorghi]|uniref:Uncharacterized protein n=1 Tax=Puccinia sorghi TaxID=27349 RepID=A0A0L6UP34_9BASI|nr:hypothetical protein VP01_4508g3 [Puccinia sorghi]